MLAGILIALRRAGIRPALHPETPQFGEEQAPRRLSHYNTQNSL